MENILADRLVNLDTVKSFATNSGFLAFTYWSTRSVFKEPYLYDPALEYKSNFDSSGEYTSSNCSEVLADLEKQRFNPPPA